MSGGGGDRHPRLGILVVASLLVVSISFHLSPPQSKHFKPRQQHTHTLVRYCIDEEEHYSLHCDDPNNNTFNEYAKLKFPFNCVESYFGIVGSCNGLICISDDQFCYNHEAFLWNPLIRKFVPIPNPNITFTLRGPFIHSLGFGFDSASNDFKVVRIVHLGLECDTVPPEVEIYTLKTGFWRIISDKALPYIVEERSQQAYINGVAHWVARTPMDVGSFRMIVSFNMNDEVFREISFPDGIAGEEKLMERMSLVVFEETPCLIQHCQYHDDPHCLIWMMKENGVVASWVKQFRIDLCGGLRKPIGMRKNGEVLVAMRDGYLVSCDPKSKRIMNLGIVGFTDLYCYHSFAVDTYTESLGLLDKGVDFL
ncbi:F-box/kelch-repeat protein At3g06240-like [Camellia sinensis]|uniref:F-box/kelch-repeat protein At3g06240-like n=1 Tax=Camellia sinensis TaxID=4442 RepID=UPI001035914B|nr:F-box/kelch-repeat protein At3g06240-like [Camellia sinensis]